MFLFSSHLFAQKEQPSGVKPGILIDGNLCKILNQQFSCVTRTCDGVIIYEGDSVSFCTDAYVDLTSDTAYYMHWNFNGSTFPASIVDTVPSNFPICYYPIWNTAGSYTVDIYYNGFLSAYPSSDCYPVPSHWIIDVTVLSAGAGGIDEHQNINEIVFPNPASNELNIDFHSTQKGNLELYSIFGEKIRNYEIKNGMNKIQIADIESGIYFYKIKNAEELFSADKIMVIK